jgi:hypothetical protein
MTSQMKRGLLVLGLAAFACDRADAGYVLTVNAAGSQSSTVSGATTETFNGFQTGVYTSLTTAVGTVTSAGETIELANQYGGAGGTGNYFVIGGQSSQTTAVLTLNGAAEYFGFWWSAADPYNTIEFLSKGSVVAEFNAATAFATLGSTYAGNPVDGGADGGEKFAYFNFIGAAGSTFDQVEFVNSGSTGFESDNWSVSANAPGTNPGTIISVVPNAVPEPSSIALTASGLLGLIGLSRTRRRR